MNSLPDEIIFQILYSLPGEDVFRFRRINSQFNKIITKYRQSLRKPWNSLHIGKKRTPRNQNIKEYLMTLETKRGYYKACVTFYMKDNFTYDRHSVTPLKSLRPLKPESLHIANFDRKHFSSFFDTGNESKTMKDLLLFFFSMGDISVVTVTTEMLREGLWMLRSAIEKSDCRFLEVRLNIHSISDAKSEDTVEGYLAAIAEKERLKNSRGISSLLKVIGIKSYRNFLNTSTVALLNSLGDLFPAPIVYMEVGYICNHIDTIIESWERAPKQPFTFRIELQDGDHTFGCSGVHCSLSSLKSRMNVKIPDSFLEAHTLANVPREMEFSKGNIPTRLRFRFQRLGTKRDGFIIRGRIDIFE